MKNAASVIAFACQVFVLLGSISSSASGFGNGFPKELEGCWVASIVIEHGRRTPESIGSLLVLGGDSVFLLRPAEEPCSLIVCKDLEMSHADGDSLRFTSSDLTSDTENLRGLTGNFYLKTSVPFPRPQILLFDILEFELQDNGKADGEFPGLDSVMTCYKIDCDETARRIKLALSSMLKNGKPPSPKVQKWVLGFLRDQGNAVKGEQLLEPPR